jgi:transposase
MGFKKRATERRRRTHRSLPVLEANAAGIDIGSAEHWVAVPIGRSEQHTCSFSAMTRGLHELADWLQVCGIETVAMEATGVYWVPLYEILEARGLRVCLVNARHAHNVPGRKSDVLDCQWLQQLHTYGLLRGSFRPGPDFVALRTYLRHRESLLRSNARFIQQMQKSMSLMNIKLDRVVSDTAGETSMRIIRDIVAGQHDPEVLARHRDPRCKATKSEIAESLRGTYRKDLLFTLRHSLELYDAHQRRLIECDAQIQSLVDAIAAAAPTIEPPETATKVRRNRRRDPKLNIHASLYRITGGVDLYQVAGIAELTAVQLIAEIGTDMSPWPTAKHFASWTTLAPGCRITGGKRYRPKRPRSTHRVAQILRMAAVSAGRTDSALGAFYRRLSARIGKAKAVVATAAKLARIIYTLLKNGSRFEETGADAYEQRYRARVVRNLKKRA